MGNQLWSGLQFLPTSPAHSLALYVPQLFLFYSSKILPLSTSIPPLPLFLISTFYFYPIRAPYTLPSLLLLCLKRSQMLPYERQSRSVIFFSASVTGSGPLLEKRKEERRKRVVGFRGALREGRPKCTTSTLTSHTTCVHRLKCRAHACIRTRRQHAGFLGHPLLQACLSNLFSARFFASSMASLLQIFLEAPFSKVRKREQAGKER